MTYLVIKRFFDLILAFGLIITLMPLYFLIAILILISSKGPVLFRQTRVGFKGREFNIFKFRTMHVFKGRKEGQTFNKSEGVFFVGSFLRRFKIDELPQLINILKGEMSFIGPRPCLKSTFDEMPAFAKKRIYVLPGITGLAQVSGNVRLSWEDRWKYDCKYIGDVSFEKDLKILLNTFRVILLGEKL